MTLEEYKNLSIELLISIFKENNFSLSLIDKTFNFSKSTSERLFKSKGIDYKRIKKETLELEELKYYKNPRICKYCGKPIPFKLKEVNNFCNKSCAASFNNTFRVLSEESKLKISEKLKEVSKNKEIVLSETNEKQILKAITIKKECTCEFCGKSILSYYSLRFCSSACDANFRTQERISLWKQGEYSKESDKIPNFIKNYLLQKHNYKCELCGFSGNNIKTGKTVLQIHHIDGDAYNLKEENLQVLCPNCHAMTDNYMGLNKGKSTRRNRYK